MSLTPITSIREFIDKRVADNNKFILSNMPKAKSGSLLGVSTYACVELDAVMLKNDVLPTLNSFVDNLFLRAVKRDFQYGHYTRVDLMLKGMDNMNIQKVGCYASLVESGYSTTAGVANAVEGVV